MFNIVNDFKGTRLPIHMLLLRQFAIQKEVLYSGFVLPNVQILFVQKISFATSRVSIDDFFSEIRWSGLQPIHLLYMPEWTFKPFLFQRLLNTFLVKQ